MPQRLTVSSPIAFSTAANKRALVSDDDSEMRITHEATVSLRLLRSVVKAVEQVRGTGALVLRAAQRTLADLDVPEGRMPYLELSRPFELACELACDPAFGLHWAERLDLNSFGLLTQLVTSSADLRQGFETLTRYSSLLGDVVGYQLIETDDRMIVRAKRMVGAPSGMTRLCSEMLVAGFFRLLRAFEIDPRELRINFAYSAPSYSAEYARVLGGPVFFEQPFTGIVFPRSLLQTPSPHRDADVHEALRTLAQRRVAPTSQHESYVVRLRAFLVRHGGAHRTDMEAAARALGLSVRSLRRRLTAEGRSYNEVADEALVIAAQKLLREERQTIQETAYALGFAKASTFHRAFKRCTGTTPSGYRRAVQTQRGAHARDAMKA